VSDRPWRVAVMAPARREFDRLPISVAAAVLETLDAIAENPSRLGKPLMLEHEGRFSATRGPYRIIYEIEADDHPVRVIAIGHRRYVDRRR
jgi:mRNA-degrading endonuclease RelE of RelBE toxin-antitoxin system